MFSKQKLIRCVIAKFTQKCNSPCVGTFVSRFTRVTGVTVAYESYVGTYVSRYTRVKEPLIIWLFCIWVICGHMCVTLHESQRATNYMALLHMSHMWAHMCHVTRESWRVRVAYESWHMSCIANNVQGLWHFWVNFAIIERLSFCFENKSTLL